MQLKVAIIMEQTFLVATAVEISMTTSVICLNLLIVCVFEVRSIPQGENYEFCSSKGGIVTEWPH
jgi:hypothetical protein